MDYQCNKLQLTTLHFFHFRTVNFNSFSVLTFVNQPEIKNTLKAMILIFIKNAGSKSFFLIFAQLKLQGRQKKKIIIIINKSNIIFIPVLEKLGSADFVNQKNK